MADLVRGRAEQVEHTAAIGARTAPGDPAHQLAVVHVHLHDSIQGLPQLAQQRIKRMCHSDSTIDLVPYEQVYGQSFEDMRRRVPDLQKIRRVVGFRPQVTLDSLLEVTIRDHERSQLPLRRSGAMLAPPRSESSRPSLLES